jgi:hypothetical protein
MPNWCQCELTITGPKKERERFKKTARKPKTKKMALALDANQFIPMPKELKIDAGSVDMLYDIWYGKVPEYDWMPKDREQAKALMRQKYKDADKIAEQQKHNIETYGSMNWWDWQTKNWSVKWGFCSVERQESKTELTYAFETPWGPATPLFIKMSQMFPELQFQLVHGGFEMGYDATTVFVNGEIASNEEREIIYEEEEQEEMEQEKAEEKKTKQKITTEEFRTRYEMIGRGT